MLAAVLLPAITAPQSWQSGAAGVVILIAGLAVCEIRWRRREARYRRLGLKFPEPQDFERRP